MDELKKLKEDFLNIYEGLTGEQKIEVFMLVNQCNLIMNNLINKLEGKEDE